MLEISAIRSAIVAEARTWIGTPFRHQGRTKGAGVDCVGLVYGVARELGLGDTDMTTDKARPFLGYARRPRGGLMETACREYLERIPAREMKPGDVYLMQFQGDPMHVALYTGQTIIHALATVRKCTEHRLDDRWRSRVCGCYRFPGVD